MVTPSPAVLAGRRIVVVGDIILDHYVMGRVDRISPEAPIPVLRAMREVETLGGAGNVVRNLVAVGARPDLVGVVGLDRQATQVAALLAEAGVAEDFLVKDSDRPTTVKTRFLAGGHPILRTDWEDDTPISGTSAEQLLRHAMEALKTAEAVVLSDYGKGVLSGDLAQRVLRAARERGLPVVVDPKAVDWTCYEGATAVTPNRGELRAAAALHRDAPTDALVAAADTMRRRYSFGAVLLTQSEEGMTLVTGEGPPLHIPARAREITDVSGAGDTVVAVLAAGIAAGLPLSEAAALANVVAGIVVGKLGTATASTAEIERELRLASGQVSVAAVRALGPAELALQIADWRRVGLRIGVACGQFAPLQGTHVRLLANARRCCDKLLVLASTPEGADVALALTMVDAVTICSEEVWPASIRLISPDLLVAEPDRKGASAGALV